MAVPAYSEITMGTVQFTCDPDVYRRSWIKPNSVDECLGGVVVIQEEARTQAGMILELQSGQRQHLDDERELLLDAMYGTGGLWPFVDGEGNEVTVYIEEWESRRVYANRYEYKMKCRVATIIKYRGEDYEGS